MDMEFKSLDEYGHYINTTYPNVRFVFEIHYTRDEYKFLTEHFFDEDINFDNSLIYFKETKEGNARHIKMTRPVEKLINELYKNKINNLVIPGKFGKQVMGMSQQWRIIVDKIIPNNIGAGKYRLTPPIVSDILMLVGWQ